MSKDVVITGNWLDSVSFDDKGLVNVVAQDHISKRVLMVAWMNREALEITGSFIRLLAERGIALQVQASATREELLLHMVDAGMGLAVVPQSHAAQARRALTRPLDGPLAFSRHIGLACDASDAPLLGLLHHLADGMKATAAQPEPVQRSNVV
eukprot:gene20138-28502_t